MKISKKWSQIATNWLGNSEGKHCHWCRFKLSEEGEVTCDNLKSKFCDGGRIRSWDGLDCAKECGYFEIDEWYTKDKNYYKTFKK